jgi:hypothetical protein
MIAILQHRRDVAGDTAHPARTDAFDPRLLDRVEDGTRRIALGRSAAMDCGIVAGEAQCHRIGVTAQDRDVIGGELAWRLRQAGALADQRGFIGRKDDLHLRLARDRLHRARDRAFQRLGRRFLRGSGLAIGDAHSAFMKWWKVCPATG